MRASIIVLGAMCLFCGAPGTLRAQMVLQADSVQLQPQIGRDAEGFSSCGVRAVVVLANPQFIDAYDFSLMLRFDMPYGTWKAGKSRTTTQAAKAGKFTVGASIPPPIRFWLASENEGKPTNPIKIIPAETKGYILEISDLVGTLRGIYSIIHGERMHFAMRYKSEPVDAVISFAQAMPDNERLPLVKCLNDLGERLSKTANQPKQ